MKKNMGTIDKAVRLTLAAVVLLLYYMNVISWTLALVLLVVAIIFAVTSLFGVCPLYIPFGISTLRKKQQ